MQHRQFDRNIEKYDRDFFAEVCSPNFFPPKIFVINVFQAHIKPCDDLSFVSVNGGGQEFARHIPMYLSLYFAGTWHPMQGWK